VDVALRFGDQPPLHAAGQGKPRCRDGGGRKGLGLQRDQKNGLHPSSGKAPSGQAGRRRKGGGEAASLLTRSTASAACPPSIHARRHYLLRMIACIVGTSLLMVDDSCFTKL
jgi:hypothetical protein